MKHLGMKKLLALVLALAMSLALAACNKTEKAEEATTAADKEAAKTETVDYVYGTLDLSYADFYYGELNDVKEDATLQLGAEDAVTKAGYRETGVYDAVSCATTQKSQMFSAADVDDENGKVTIEGVADVPVAVPQTLYDEANAALKAGKTAKNKILEFVDDLEVTKTAPSECKVLNGDGTLTAMKSEKKTDKTAEVTFGTESPWGQYQINVRGGDTSLPMAPAVYGVVLETSDGERFGLKHGMNIWINAAELSFSTTEGFREPHGNVITAGSTKGLAGKTISKITYLVKGGTMEMKGRGGETTTIESDGVDIVIPCELEVA